MESVAWNSSNKLYRSFLYIFKTIIVIMPTGLITLKILKTFYITKPN